MFFPLWATNKKWFITSAPVQSSAFRLKKSCLSVPYFKFYDLDHYFGTVWRKKKSAENLAGFFFRSGFAYRNRKWMRTNKAPQRSRVPLFWIWLPVTAHRMRFAIILQTIFLLVVVHGAKIEKHKRNCDSLEIPLCKGLLTYNLVTYPNLLGHKDQKEAWKEILDYRKLISDGSGKCRVALGHFLCHLYAPQWTISEGVLPPCRDSCTNAHDSCIKELSRRNLAWPKTWKCEGFPDAGLCVETLSASPGERYYMWSINRPVCVYKILNAANSVNILKQPSCKINKKCPCKKI